MDADFRAVDFDLVDERPDTRHTLVEILKRSGRLAEFKINLQAFMAAVAKEISRALHDLMLEGIKYEKVAGQHWEMSRIEQEGEEGIVRYLGNLYEVQNREKALFDAIVYDSEVERQFARDLDHNENVKLFVKLPSWLKIDTPIGTYNPTGPSSQSATRSSTSCARRRARSTARSGARRKIRRSLADAGTSPLLGLISLL